MKQYLFPILIFLLALLPATATRAQGPGNGGPRPNATTAPIDGGVSLLLAAGAAYGLKKLRAPYPLSR